MPRAAGLPGQNMKTITITREAFYRVQMGDEVKLLTLAEIGALHEQCLLLLSPHALQMDDVFSVVVAEFQIAVTDIQSPRRTAAIADARHSVCWLARKILKLNYETIGRAVRKDHGSVMWGEKRILDLIQTYPRWKERVAKMEAALHMRAVPEKKASEE